MSGWCGLTMVRPVLTLVLAASLLVLAGAQVIALELVMFTQPGCPYCRHWERAVEPVYVRSDEGKRAPLVKRDIRAPRMDLRLAEPVIYTPTFVLIDNGTETGRITGYISDDMFWGLLGKMLDRTKTPAP